MSVNAFTPIALTCAIVDVAFHPRPQDRSVAAVGREELFEEPAQLGVALGVGADRSETGWRAHPSPARTRSRARAADLPCWRSRGRTSRATCARRARCRRRAPRGSPRSANTRMPASSSRLIVLRPCARSSRACAGVPGTTSPCASGGHDRRRGSMCTLRSWCPCFPRRCPPRSPKLLAGSVIVLRTSPKRAGASPTPTSIASPTRSRPACRARGVGEGDVLALVLPPGPEYLLAYCAAAKVGAITAGVNDRLSARERAAVLDLAGPKLVIDTCRPPRRLDDGARRLPRVRAQRARAPRRSRPARSRSSSRRARPACPRARCTATASSRSSRRPTSATRGTAAAARSPARRSRTSAS